MKDLDTLNKTLLSTMVTSTDAKGFIESIDQAIASIFSTKSTFEEMFAELFPHTQKLVLLDLVTEAGLTRENATGLQKLFEGIRDTVSAVPVMEMTVAVEPSERSLYRIKEWIDSHSTTKVFLDIKVNPRIIGGVRIAYNGKYHDYSVKKTLIERI